MSRNSSIPEEIRVIAKIGTVKEADALSAKEAETAPTFFRVILTDQIRELSSVTDFRLLSISTLGGNHNEEDERIQPGNISKCGN